MKKRNLSVSSLVRRGADALMEELSGQCITITSL
jgi:hypothetical protein